jgi:hypothetical protein
MLVEYTVLNDVLADNLDIKILSVEFNEFHYRKPYRRIGAVLGAR